MRVYSIVCLLISLVCDWQKLFVKKLKSIEHELNSLLRYFSLFLHDFSIIRFDLQLH